jgi:hypothetical protein
MDLGPVDLRSLWWSWFGKSLSVVKRPDYYFDSYCSVDYSEILRVRLFPCYFPIDQKCSYQRHLMVFGLRVIMISPLAWFRESSRTLRMFLASKLDQIYRLLLPSFFTGLLVALVFIQNYQIYLWHWTAV